VTLTLDSVKKGHRHVSRSPTSIYIRNLLEIEKKLLWVGGWTDGRTYRDPWGKNFRPRSHSIRPLHRPHAMPASFSWRLSSLSLSSVIEYDTIEEFSVDSKAEYTALSSTRSQKLKQTKAVPLLDSNKSDYGGKDLWKRWVLSLEWIIIIIIIVKFIKRHTRSYRGASWGVNQAA